MSGLNREIVTADQYEVEVEAAPPAVMWENPRWFVWMYDDDRKIPRAPWANPSRPEKWVSWKEEGNWTSIDEAASWAEKYPGFELATCIPEYDIEDNDAERLILIDCDNVRDTETGDIHPDAWHFVVRQLDAPVYLSTSGTGLHAYAVTTLPEGTKPCCTIELPSWDHSEELGEPEIEFYAGDRFIAYSGAKIAETAEELPDVSDVIHDIFESHGRRQQGASATTNARAADVEKGLDRGFTGDLDVVYTAADNVRPRDIRLRSTVTNERADGSKDLDPSWETSESGTRLAEVGDGWIYRQGMVGLSAIQIVALEERIITSVGEYPSGEAFKEAVDALRDRGAEIPEYVDSKAELAEREIMEQRENDDDDPVLMTDGGVDEDDDTETFTFEPDGWIEAARYLSGKIADKEMHPQEGLRDIAQEIVDDLDLMIKRTNEDEGQDAEEATLYLYTDEYDYYEPRGTYFLKKNLPRFAPYLSSRKINEIVKLVRLWSEVPREKWNAGGFDDRLVPFENGVFNIDTDEFLDHDPKYRFTHKLPVEFDPNAEDDATVEFIDDITGSEEDYLTIMQWLGFIFESGYRHDKFLLLTGDGGNGKTILTRVLKKHLLGKSQTSSVGLNQLGTDNQQNFVIGELEDSLLNVDGDTDGFINDESWGALKKSTGGDDLLASEKYGGHYDIDNDAKMMFIANDPPTIVTPTKRDLGRRLLHIHFPFEYVHNPDPDAPLQKPAEDERELLNRISSDAALSTLFLRAVEEYGKIRHTGEFECVRGMSPKDVALEYEGKADTIIAFAQECLENEEEWFLPSDVIYNAYTHFCKRENDGTAKKSTLMRRLGNDPEVDLYESRPGTGSERCTGYKMLRFTDDACPMLSETDKEMLRSWNDPERVDRYLGSESSADVEDDDDGETAIEDLSPGQYVTIEAMAASVLDPAPWLAGEGTFSDDSGRIDYVVRGEVETEIKQGAMHRLTDVKVTTDDDGMTILEIRGGTTGVEAIGPKASEQHTVTETAAETDGGSTTSSSSSGDAAMPPDDAQGAAADAARLTILIDDLAGGEMQREGMFNAAKARFDWRSEQTKTALEYGLRNGTLIEPETNLIRTA